VGRTEVKEEPLAPGGKSDSVEEEEEDGDEGGGKMELKWRRG